MGGYWTLKKLEFVRKNIFEPDLELAQNRLQFVKRQMVFTTLNSVQGCVRKSDLFAKLGI